MNAGLRWARADNPSPMTLDGTRTYVVGRARPVVIDPGPALESHTRRVLELLDGATPLAIVLTHAHSDHAGGAEALARATRAPVWLGAGERGGASRLPRVDRLVGRGDHLETDAGTLEIIPTPGHAPEHICVRWTALDQTGRGDLFAGDMFLGQGDTTLIAAPGGSVADYLRSLDVVEELRPEVIHPAHGGPLADYRDVIGRYRRHRLERIDQVRQALAEGGTLRGDELLDRIYGESLDPRLRPAARGSLQAILEFLGAAATPR